MTRYLCLFVFAGLVLGFQWTLSTSFLVSRGNRHSTRDAMTNIALAKGDNVIAKSPLVSEQDVRETSNDTVQSSALESNSNTTSVERITKEEKPLEAPKTYEGFADFASKKTPLLAELLMASDQGQNSTLAAPKPEKTPLPPTTPLATTLNERSSELAVVALATTALAGFLGDALSNYEWVQTLRYFWPLTLGVYYGLLLHRANDSEAALREQNRREFGPTVAFSTNSDGDDDWGGLVLQLAYIFGGFGLFVGGLADAVLPVWMTGPNWITNAGLAPDCAVLLLGLSVGEAYGLLGASSGDPNTGSSATDANLPETGKAVGSGTDGTILGSSITNNNNNNDMTSLLLRITLWAELYKLGESSLDEVFCNLQSFLSSAT